MATIRKVKGQDLSFTKVPNVFINDRRLSLKAGMLGVFLLSKPDTWIMHVSHFAEIFKEGKAAIYSAIKELESFGYIMKQGQSRSDKGNFKDFEYLFSITPYDFEEIDLPLTDNQHTDTPPLTDFPLTDYPRAGNRTLVTIDLSKTDIKNKKTKAKKEKTDVAIAPCLVNLSDDINFLFENVRSMYPKHARKSYSKAFTAFCKLNPTEPLTFMMIDALRSQEEERRLYVKYGVFIAGQQNFATWINQKGWTNEVLTEKEIKMLAAEQAKTSGKIFNDLDELKKRPSRMEMNGHARI